MFGASKIVCLADTPPDQKSAGNHPDRSSLSSSSWAKASSSSSRREFLQKFVDNDLFTSNLEGWFSALSDGTEFRKNVFDEPFDLTELQQFDYALEGIPFQQLIRMPNALYAGSSNAVEATAQLAIEDFLHASVKGLWETFWGDDAAMPFTVACFHSTSSKFYPAEKIIANGKLEGLCATCIMLKSNKRSRPKWEHIVELALLRPDTGTLSAGIHQQPSLLIIGEALFFALRVLLARSLSRSNTILRNSNCVFVLLVDSQYGGVVKVEGDVNKMDFRAGDVYASAAEWIKYHSKISVSPVDKIWNKLGNANWGDFATLQLLHATFQSIIQLCGVPKKKVEDMANKHITHLQSRRTERQLVDTHTPVNGVGLFRFQQCAISSEIVEVQDETIKETDSREILNLEKGSVIWLEDGSSQGYQIFEVLGTTSLPIYIASPVEEPEKKFMLYVGYGLSQMDPACEDMNLWYHVQRQTKILNLMKEGGISSKYFPELISSGRMVHPGECNRPSSSGSCGHPWCGAPILITSPVGESVSDMISHGKFDSDEALRCCHDCLSALSISASVGIQHGDIHPDNIIHVTSDGKSLYVLIGWGHAIIEDRDCPSINIYFSSTFALQEAKLCAASDAESLIYLLYFACGGELPGLGSAEGALQWREMAWSRRIIQQKLGEISAVLKAFGDYVDSLCGTPYPIDYEIWLRRLKRTINEDDRGKQVDVS